MIAIVMRSNRSTPINMPEFYTTLGRFLDQGPRENENDNVMQITEEDVQNAISFQAAKSSNGISR